MYLYNKHPAAKCRIVHLRPALSQSAHDAHASRNARFIATNFCFIAINITIQQNHSTLRKLGPII